MLQIAILTLLIIAFQCYGQTRTITGKVLFDDFSPVIDARILGNEMQELGTTNANGDFTIQTPSGTSELLFGMIGMEIAIVKVPSSCDHVEIIMIPEGTFHYRSHRKVDRIRKSFFDKLPELHLQAYEKGLFKYGSTCYSREFKPDKPQLDEIRKELRIERKRVKTLFNKLEIGDTIQVPFSGTYRSDGTDRTTLTPWAYFTDATKSQCIIEGIITNKDKRNSGYNIEIKVTDYKSCKYDTPIIYQEKDMVIGTVFRHNMRNLKVSTR